MADIEQLKQLKKGPLVWNNWRRENPDIQPDFRDTDLHDINLVSANLRHVSFWGCNLGRAKMDGADLYKAQLDFATLNKASLRKANLNFATLVGAKLKFTDFSESILDCADLSAAEALDSCFAKAHLNGVQFFSTNLARANFSQAELVYSTFMYSTLSESNFDRSVFGFTKFIDVDLSRARNLESGKHSTASSISFDTILRSKGRIPSEFLLGCGLRDWEIEHTKLYASGLDIEELQKIQERIRSTRMTQSIQVYPIFISYSHKDSSFVEALEAKLKEAGVRFWRDVHDVEAGPLESQIRAAIQERVVLIVLSENSIQSDWVELEIEYARSSEKEQSRNVLCPITLDNAWKTTMWPDRLQNQLRKYAVLDFSNWESRQTFEEMFSRLLRGLRQWYEDITNTRA